LETLFANRKGISRKNWKSIFIWERVISCLF
jgi:hypothetical protein